MKECYLLPLIGFSFFFLLYFRAFFFNSHLLEHNLLWPHKPRFEEANKYPHKEVTCEALRLYLSVYLSPFFSLFNCLSVFPSISLSFSVSLSVSLTQTHTHTQIHLLPISHNTHKHTSCIVYPVTNLSPNFFKCVTSLKATTSFVTTASFLFLHLLPFG